MYYASQESIDDDIDIIESQLLQEQHQGHQEPRHQEQKQQQEKEWIADERSNITDAHQQRFNDGDIVPLPKPESSRDSLKSKSSSSDRESYISNSDRKYRRRQRGHRGRSDFKRRSTSSCSNASSRSSHQSVPLKDDEKKKQHNVESDGSNDSRDPQRRYYCSFDDYSSPGSSRDFRSSRSYSRSSHYSNDDRSYYSRSSYYSSSTYNGSNNRRYYSSDDSATDERSRRNNNGSVQSRGINDAVCTTDSNDNHKFDGPSSSLSSINNVNSSEKEERSRSRRSSQENDSIGNKGDALGNVNENPQRAIFENKTSSNVDGEVVCSKRSSFDHHPLATAAGSSPTRKNSSKYHRPRTSSAGSRRSTRRRRSKPLRSNNGNGSFSDGEDNELNEPPITTHSETPATKRRSRGYLPASSGKSRDERRSTTSKSKRRSRTLLRNDSVSDDDKNNINDKKEAFTNTGETGRRRESSHRLGATERHTRRSKTFNKNNCNFSDDDNNDGDVKGKEPYTKSTSDKRRSSRNHLKSDTRRSSRNHVKSETRRSSRNHRRVSREHNRSTHKSGGGFLDDNDSHDDVKEPETTALHSPPTADLTTREHQDDLINISDCPTAAAAVEAAKAKQEFLQRMRANDDKIEEEKDYCPMANFSSGTSSRTKEEEEDEAERRLADALKKKDQELMDFMNAQNDAFNKKRHQEHYLKTLQEHQMFEEEEEEDEHPPPLTDLVLKGNTIRRSSNSASPGTSNKKKHAGSKGVLTSAASGTGSSGGEYDCNKTTSSTGTDAVSAITLPFELVHMATQSTMQPTSPSSFLPNYLLKKYQGNTSAATATATTGTSSNPLPLATSTSPTPKTVNMLDQQQDSSKLSPSPHLSSLQQDANVHEGYGTRVITTGEMISSQLDIIDNTQHVEEEAMKAQSPQVLETSMSQQPNAAGAPAPASSPTTRSRQFLFGTSKTNSSNEITSTKSLWNNLRKKPSVTAGTGGRRNSTEMVVSDPSEQQHNKKVSKLKLGGLFANRVGSGRSQNQSNNKQMSKTHHGGAGGGSGRRLLFGRRQSQECKDDDNDEHPTPKAADIEKFNVSRTFHGGAGAAAGAGGIMHLFNKNRRHSATGQDNPHENNNEYDEAQEEGAEEEDANNHPTMFIPFPSQQGTTTSSHTNHSSHVPLGAAAAGPTSSVTGTSTSMFGGGGGGRSITSIASGANSGAGAAAAAAAAAADAATKAAAAAAAAVTLRASSITSATTKAFEDVASSATATASKAANAAAESSSNTKATIGKMLGRGRKAAAMHAQMPNFSEEELKLLREEKEKQLQQYKCSLRGSTTTTGTVHNIVGSESFQLSTMMEDSWRSGGGDAGEDIVGGGRGGFDVSFRDLNLGSSGNTTRRSSNPKDAKNPSELLSSSSHVITRTNDLSGSFSTDNKDIFPLTNLCSQVSELSARSHTNFVSVNMDADEQLQHQQGYRSAFKQQSHSGTSNDDDSMDSIDVGGTNKHGEENDVDEDEEIYDDAGWRRRSHDLRISSNKTSEDDDDDDMISRIMDEGSVLVSFADVRPHSHHWESDADAASNADENQQHHETNVSHEKKLQHAQVMQV